MKKYIKKPVVIDAIQWDGTEDMAFEIATNNDFQGMMDFKTGEFGGFYIDTSEGRFQVFANDYIIKKPIRGYYVLNSDLFELLYEESL